MTKPFKIDIHIPHGQTFSQLYEDLFVINFLTATQFNSN